MGGTIFITSLWKKIIFLSDPGIPGVRSMGPSVSKCLQDVLQTSDLSKIEIVFLSDPGIPGVRSVGPGVSHSLTDVWLT